MTVITKPNGQIVVSLPQFQLEQETDPATGLQWASVAAASAWEAATEPALDAQLTAQLTPPPPPPPPPDAVWKWYIDIGPFFDRLGAQKMAVLTSANVNIKALISDLQVRKWVDLQRADVAQGLALIGSVIPAVTPAMQAVVVSTVPTQDENLALRKVYFS